jgi:pimeloyl-ACP methyl ester carboxylesterase
MSRLIALLVLLMSGLTLCAQELPTQPGVVFLVGGAGGIENLHTFTRWAMKQAKLPHEIKHFDWTHGKGRFVKDIQDTRHLLLKAEELRQQILKYHAEYPDRPIYLIGKSTGCFIVLWAAEKLPIASLEKVILLSPAVSPGYDLAEAISSIRTTLVSYRSRYDVFILDWATSIVGTADRQYSSSAGKKGFTKPVPPLPEHDVYSRLIQIDWSLDKVWYGHLGGHLGNGMPLFLFFEVMPLLKVERQLAQRNP